MTGKRDNDKDIQSIQEEYIHAINELIPNYKLIKKKDICKPNLQGRDGFCFQKNNCELEPDN